MLRRRPGRLKPGENPFRFGDIARGEHFTDRDPEIAELASDLRSGQNVLILSPRRFGKTSLIVEVAARLRRDDVLVAYVDLLRITSKAQLAGYLATALYEGLVPPVERLIHKAGELFRELPLRPKISIGQDGTPSFEFSTGSDDIDVEVTLDRLLAFPNEVARARGRRAVIILDEFQEIVDLAPDLPARMRSIFQFQPEVSHVYLGSRQHMLRRVFSEANQPLYNSAKVFTLGPITPAVFAPFVDQRFAASDRQITDEAVTHLLSITGGHPHDTQKLCYFTWALTSAGVPATASTVDEAIERVLAADTARYTELWDSLTTNQRRMLDALARAPQQASPLREDFRRRNRLGSYASTERALDALVERGMVERTGRQAASIPDVFLRLWLQAEPTQLSLAP
jgi:AAA+ ATPase superfamily predicted ATPase